MQIEVSIVVDKNIDKVWEFWTNPEHIVHWNFAHESWMCPHAINNLRVGGEFNYRMEARDHSFGFDFSGVYHEIIPHEKIAFTLGERNVTVLFVVQGDKTTVKEIFDADDSHSVEQQKSGWLAILNNFKLYIETYNE